MTELATAYFRGHDGVRLAYRELGEGRPLILIHGYLSTAMAMAGIAGKIAGRGYRVILPDLRGHGDGHNATAGALADALPNGQYIELPGDHGTAIATPQFEAAIVSFLDGRAAAG